MLANRTYRHLFAAQILSLLGTGLATVALGLLAFDLAGADAGAVLGTALAIKMIAYVGVAPVAGAFVHRVPRRALLVALDLVRAAIALALPFVTEIWQVYVLIFLLQSGSAAFTPTFQATIPDILPDEADYTTRAVALAPRLRPRGLASPMLAAALLGGHRLPLAVRGNDRLASSPRPRWWSRWCCPRRKPPSTAGGRLGAHDAGRAHLSRDAAAARAAGAEPGGRRGRARW